MLVGGTFCRSEIPRKGGGGGVGICMVSMCACVPYIRHMDLPVPRYDAISQWVRQLGPRRGGLSCGGAGGTPFALLEFAAHGERGDRLC